MPGGHERPEAEHGGECGHEHAATRRGAEAIGAALAPAAIIVEHVDAVVHADAHDERQGDHVGRVHRDAEDGHDAEREHHADGEREKAEEQILHAAKVEGEHDHDGDQSVDSRPFEADFHLKQALAGAEGLARGFRVGVRRGRGEALKRRIIPQAFLGEGADEKLAVGTDVALAEFDRQIVRSDRNRLRDGLQAIQISGQIRDQTAIERVQPLEGNLRLGEGREEVRRRE